MHLKTFIRFWTPKAIYCRRELLVVSIYWHGNRFYGLFSGHSCACFNTILLIYIKDDVNLLIIFTEIQYHVLYFLTKLFEYFYMVLFYFHFFWANHDVDCNHLLFITCRYNFVDVRVYFQLLVLVYFCYHMCVKYHLLQEKAEFHIIHISKDTINQSLALPKPIYIKSFEVSKWISLTEQFFSLFK